MNFRTPLPPKISATQLEYGQPVLSIGSCFSHHIAEKLAGFKFDVVSNPFGTTYNPLSLAAQLSAIRTGRIYEKIDLYKAGETWVSFDHHGSFSTADAQTSLGLIHRSMQHAGGNLGKYRWTILSLGTAWAWFRDGEVVNNCHKLPSSEFDHRLLEIEEIADALQYELEQWKRANPDVTILLTVSPVRHLRTGMEANNRSKARLLEAVHSLCDRLEFAHYYPAWELIMDDLRDYRFFERDRIHPTEEAVQYVWEHFAAGYISDHTREIMQAFASFRNLLNHEPRQRSGAGFEGHLRQLEKSFHAWRQRWPDADWSREEKRWNDLLR